MRLVAGEPNSDTDRGNCDDFRRECTQTKIEKKNQKFKKKEMNCAADRPRHLAGGRFSRRHLQKFWRSLANRLENVTRERLAEAVNADGRQVGRFFDGLMINKIDLDIL